MKREGGFNKSSINDFVFYILVEMSFNYHQAGAYSYAVIDPNKFRFARSPHYRPPTPPVFKPPKNPNFSDDPPEEEKEGNEAVVEGEGGESKPEEESGMFRLDVYGRSIADL